MLKPTGPLSPFRRDLAMPLADASEYSGRAINTVRDWCKRYHLGRKIGGEWLIDAVAFHLFIEGRLEALARYLNGDRADPETVAAFQRLGAPLAPPPPPTRKHASRGEAGHATA